ncbi:MAG: ABC transporter ATP-binding protein [Candidatus Thermoplasmatota archaeon]|nr:ABC transporter ATP-binding protein [Candidatus Thermoplasmatota archaeon]MBU4256325.1 ABC transporter ATP-binding protein [Candidatus Thermoplasmatota archaeon]MCG2825794.1 ABC transporter ATP-binding protein [Thermoplasmatales archaeon]
MSEIAIKVEGLTKQYRNGVLALQGIDFEINKGDCVGYLGPNGAGKTTTIKLLTNLIRPTSGKMFINDIDVSKHSKRALRHIGALIEVPGMQEYLTPNEMLTYFGRIHGISKEEIEKRIEKVLWAVMLSDWKDKKIGSFSTGMLRRLIIAQTMLHNPDILILDEPALGLDPKGMQDIRFIIKQLRSEGKTVFLSSHLLHEVSETCNKVILLDKGKIMTYDTVDNLKNLSKIKMISIEFLSPLTKQQIASIQSIEFVRKIDTRNTYATIEFDGDRTTCSQILTQLISNGFQIVSYKPEAATLEDVYVSIIGKEGSGGELN